jgi:hypothetical protein
MRTNSENHETCRVVIISYAYVVVKIWKFFEHVGRTMLINQNISTKHRKGNVLETFSNFYHGIRIWYNDNSTSFMIFGIRQVEKSWFVSIVRPTCSKLFQILPRHTHTIWRQLDKFHDFRNSFAFYIIKKPLAHKLAALPREHVDRNFETVSGFSLNLH